MIASKVEEEAMKGAKEALKETLGTSKADASGSVPKSAVLETAGSEAAASEATQSAKVDQIPDPHIISSPSSSTNSDLDNIPLSQKYKLSKPSPKSKLTLKSKTKTSSKPKLSPKTKPFKLMYPDILKSIGELKENRIHTE